MQGRPNHVGAALARHTQRISGFALVESGMAALPQVGIREPLEWVLLTTVAVSGLADALERVQWYARRWGFEVFHRILKSGCQIEDRQLGTADRLEACLAIDAVVAWRIHYLTWLGRATPDLPCTVAF
jgi:hypothetical protein